MVQIGRNVEEIGMQAMSDLDSQYYLIDDTGEQARVLIVLDANPSPDPEESQQPCIVKIARDDRFMRETVLEANLLRQIEQRATQPPLQVPRIYGVEDTLGYVVMSEVPGAVLSEAYIQKEFSKEERRLLGEKIGRFTAWMATEFALRDETGERHVTFAYPEVWEQNSRINMLIEFIKFSHISRADYPELTALLTELLDECHGWQWAQANAPETIGPTFIGHYDVRPGNLTFRRIKGVWQAIGIFDFATAQATSWGAEVRHARRIGKDVSDAALAQSPLAGTDSDELVNFWAQTQAATACGLAILSGRSIPPLVKEVITQFYPHKDWTELDRV